MPVLDLTGDTRQDAHIVLATMCYPNDNDKRHQLLTQIMVNESVDEFISLANAKCLNQAPAYDDEMFVKDKSRVTPFCGWFAGKLLEYIAIMEAHGKSASKRKALDLLIKHLCGTRTIENKAVNYSKRVLEKYWYEFQKVAPLWTAWSSCLGNSRYEWSPYMEGSAPVSEAFSCFSETQFPEFLALADWFRKFGDKHKSPNQKYGYTLKDAWRVPNSYPLPELRVSLDMPSWINDELDSYKPKS